MTPDSGLVGYWRLDEGSGNIAFDHSYFNANGNLENAPAYVDACTSASCSNTSVQEKQIEISWGPNPSSGHLFIQADRQIQEIWISDFTGKIELISRPMTKKTELDLENLAGGTYLLKIVFEKKIEVRKVVIR